MPDPAKITVYGVPKEQQDIGDLVRLDAHVKVASVLTDAAVTARVLPPEGAAADATVERLNVGKYRVDLKLTQAGPYNVRFVIDSPAHVGVTEVQVVARPSAVV